MRTAPEGLTGEYASALVDYLRGGGEAALMRAYQVGRGALTEGMGVLEVAALHQEALVTALLHMLAPEESAQTARRASEFFAESLAPFEATQRGFMEANAILRDINHQLEERVQRILRDYEVTRDQLDQQRRLEALKNDFLSVVSHELRTPLTSIYGSLNLLATGVVGELPAPARQLVEVAYRNSQRLARLVDDILDLQKIESGAMAFHLRPVELRPLLEQAVEANQAYAQRLGVELVLEETPATALVYADPDRLIQVMTNLLSNAAKFSPAGQAVRVAAARQDGTLVVAISDRGPGIPDEFRGRIFERFAQADVSSTREKGGTGLGLSITKAIVERLGGTIGFETRLGAGTTFHFELPEWRKDAGLRAR